jgi:predicted nucleotidyltransferase
VASQAPSLTAALHQICGDLDELAVAYALVGGLAVSAWAEPRLTRDVDLAIAADDDLDAEHSVRELASRGYRVTATVEQIKTGRLATVRLKPPGRAALVIDLLFASCGIESEIVAAAKRTEILPGLRVPVARIGHLIAMKLLARDDRARPQDLDDIRALLKVATAADRRLVATTIAQITDRGFARGRDLRVLWKSVAPHTKRRN